MSAVMSWKRDPAWTMVTLAGFAVLGLFLVWPLVTTFAYSFRGTDGSYGLGGYATFFRDRAYRDSLWNTLILGGAVTATSMIVGGALAVLVARCRFRFSGWVTALPLVTLVIPDVVVAAAWTLILGRQGIVNTWLLPADWQIGSLYSWWGLIFVMTLNSYVYAFVMILVGLKAVDGNLEEAAMSLGRPLPRVLTGVTLPLILPSIFGAALVVFTHVIGSFGIPAILGARTPVLAVKAYNEFVSELGGNPQMQTTMATLLVLLGVVMLAVQKLVIERGQYQMESGRTPLAIPIRGVAGTVAAALVVLVVMLSMAPAVVAVITAFTPSRGPVLSYGGFTLIHMTTALTKSAQPLWNSLSLAAIATVAGVIFSVAVAYLVVKRRSALTGTLDVLVMLPLTIAGTVLGIALVNTFNTGWLVLTGTWIIMALAYFLRRIPNSVRAAVGPLHNVRDSIEEASISLGVPPLRSFFKVVMPLIRPAVAAAAILMWVTSLSELSTTIVLYYGGMSTMPIEIFQQVDSGRLALASAYSVILMLAIFVPLAIARWVFRVKVDAIQ
ncbi:MAG: iron ABC transporter permease [Betaproteobacteria bacterium]|nr:iron ABC transporter permease [Betaproteobacteria bacterium]